jgi:hypothetical protein
MECSKTEDDLLRDQMQEMQKLNLQKRAQREKQNVMHEAAARLDREMREEYQMLQATGQVHASISFDEYKAWRKVAWGDGMLSDDGHYVGPKPALTPRPPIPESMRTGKKDDKTPGVTASKYGLDNDTMSSLEALHKAACPNNDPKFEDWLETTLGLKAVTATGPAGLREARANYDHARDALKNMKPQSASATTSSDGGALSLDETKELARQIALLDMLDDAGVDLGTPDPRKDLRTKLTGAKLHLSQEDAEAFDDWTGNGFQMDMATMRSRLLQELKKVANAALDRVDPSVEHVGSELDIGLVHGKICYFTNKGGSWHAEPIDGLGIDQGQFTGPGSVLGEILSLAPDVHLESLTSGEHGPFEALTNLKQKPKGPEKTGAGGATPPPSPEQQQKSFDSALAAARKKLDDGSKQIGMLLGMPSNPDGSLYGEVPKGAEAMYEYFVARGTIKKGKSPEEVRKEEEERKSAEAEYKAFMNGTGAGNVEKAAMQLTHSGSLEELKAAEDKAKNDLDSIGDLSSLAQMRLQQMMERRSKVLETLSNVMKKMAQLSDSIISNTK